MAEINYPGVYIEEVPKGVRAIEGVPTSVAAFAGWTAAGPVDAELVTSWSDFEIKFGGLDNRSLLGYSVYHFFDNGGSKAYVVRLASGSDNGLVLQPNQSDFENALLPPTGVGGLYLLDGIDSFNILCVPGETRSTAIQALQEFCRERRAFLIVDCNQEAAFDDLKHGVTGITGEDSMNSAFYYPWVLAPDKLQNDLPRELPPCGFVAGIFARTDITRGVWKAPAGIDAKLKGVTGVAPDKYLTDDDNGTLNRLGINCIRTFPIYDTVVWGARTLRGSNALASEWKYIPVRRTALFIEESLYRGLQWVVFETNQESLWAEIRSSVGTFMHNLYRKGAFQGATPRDAYFVKCDRETTTQNDVDLGRVNIIVGFAPLKPAEFVIIKLQQLTRRDYPGDPD